MIANEIEAADFFIFKRFIADTILTHFLDEIIKPVFQMPAGPFHAGSNSGEYI